MASLLACAAVAVALLVVLSSGRAASGSTRLSAVPPGTFVSLVPACACGRHTDLDLFSILSGRRLKQLTTITPPAQGSLLTPVADDAGTLFMTSVQGAVCDTHGGVYAECPKIIPDSCQNTVQTLAVGQRAPRQLFSAAGSQSITSAVVPSPNGRSVALSLTPCTNLQQTSGLFIRDLGTGVMRPLMTSANACDGFGPVAWNSGGTELVFPLERAGGKPFLNFGEKACPSGRTYLAIASTAHGTGAQRPRLVDPDHGCEFRSAAFDPKGIVAAEGCNQGDPEHGVGAFLGYAYLLQYDLTGYLVKRIQLHLGLEEAHIATDPRTGNVLITQDQPANEPYPERDWVWEFDGVHLRLIAHYAANDAAQIIAIPW